MVVAANLANMLAAAISVACAVLVGEANGLAINSGVKLLHRFAFACALATFAFAFAFNRFGYAIVFAKCMCWIPVPSLMLIMLL